MTSRERVLRAVNFQDIDRVPIDLHNFLMMAYASGLPYPKYFQKWGGDGRGLDQSLAEPAAGLDLCHCLPGRHSPQAAPGQQG